MLVAAPGFRELAVTLFAPLPEQLKPDRVSQWVQLNRRGSATGTFLEGPVLMPNGDVCCVDIPGGRILRVSPPGEWSVVCAYDGWPNGMKLLPDGRLLVADARRGLVRIDPASGSCEDMLTHAITQGFLGLNDLQVTVDGAVWFTDQGQTGLHDPSGRVYRWHQGELRCVLDRLPSPNGLRVSADGSELYVAVKRDNSVWRAPLTASLQPIKVGRFASFHGPTGPDGIHIDQRGLLWVCLPGADAVWVLNRKAEVIARAAFADGAFPSNLAMDEEGQRVLVTCSGAETICAISAL
jgi:gluconolactonase